MSNAHPLSCPLNPCESASFCGRHVAAAARAGGNPCSRASIRRALPCTRAAARAARRIQSSIELDCIETLIDEDSPVVKAALKLWQQEPKLSALEVLDLAIEGHDGRSLDYEFGDELEPPHRFSELIRQAFAPHLDRIELLISSMEDEPNDVIRTEWHLALIRFSKRYKIWEPQK